ncbi:MAG: 1,4-beta-N-acetylmuramidase [Clostridia bacterium]|nr:1,4-beta-N-acetylmuramidase [Clostridia bacterium]
MKKFGIDISKWQGDFDFKKAIKEGVTFVIIKGGGGDNGLYTDVKFEENYAEAKKNNIPVGVYWFSKATTVKEAEDEAEYFYQNVLKKKQFELPVYIDVEHKSMLALGKDKLTEIVSAWCNRLETIGFWVGIYSTVYAFSAYMNDEALERYTHWVAQWAEECTYKKTDVLGVWQFGGETNLLRKNTVADVVCDQNYMYRDFPTIIKELGLNGFNVDAEPVITIPKSVETLAKEVIDGKWGNGTERRLRLENAGYDYEDVQRLVNLIMYGMQYTSTTAKPTADKVDNTVKAGDLVKLSSNGVIYGTNKKFAPFVYTSLLYVRELKNNRAVISVVAEGPVTGAVDVKYLTKHKA